MPIPKDASRNITAGTVFAIPLGTYGFCTGVVSRSPHPNTNLIHVYLRLENTNAPFQPKTIGLPHTWPSTWVGLLTTKCLSSGRWTVLGQIPKFDPATFPVPPTGWSMKLIPEPGEEDTFWIQTTLDESSMTPITCVEATKEQAACFPPLNIVIAGSSLEKSLVKVFRKMHFTHDDAEIEGIVVKSKEIDHWNHFAEQQRRLIPTGFQQLLPAGSKTDRQAKPGDWFGFPMAGGGFGAAILIDRPEKHQRFFSDTIVCSVLRRWDSWPRLEDVEGLTAEDGALVSQTSFISVRDGMWRKLGSHHKFNKSEWPWPLRWDAEKINAKESLLTIRVGVNEEKKVQVSNRILALDERAGRVMAGMSDSLLISINTHRLMHNVELRKAFRDYGVVTPERLKAWKAINTAIFSALEKS